ncbi:MAG: 2-oxo acid dehydrogenase subunit E2 [Ktedonobacteraceae bacterium]|nr:2-oxo acid dehydrogenase subunit E2 [Ktedonobacteraceae bacterium]
MTDRYEKLDPAERWFFDILSMGEPPGFFVLEDVEMTAARELMNQARQQGFKLTYTHILVRATALALSRHPELHRLILGNKLVYPGTIDIGTSVSSPHSQATQPAMILQNAGQRTLLDLAQEIAERGPQVREGNLQRVAKLRRVARLIPSSWLRRRLLRLMKGNMAVIRKRTGSFHVTSIPHLRVAIPFKYPTPAVLTFPRVEERVVVKDGQPVVRLMTTLGFAGDHRLWHANSAGIILQEVKQILEQGELAAELPQEVVALAS